MTALTIVGSYVGSLADMAELMQIARAGDLPAMPVTSRPLDQADAALVDLAAGRIRGRTVLRP